MLIKTSELTGAALDWAVGECTKVNTYMVNYHPSTDWAEGGPIIEWEGIDLYCNVPSSVCVGKDTSAGWVPSWRAKLARCGVGSDMFYGPTPLIAAMRCFVASKMGETIDIPDELCEDQGK